MENQIDRIPEFVNEVSRIDRMLKDDFYSPLSKHGLRSARSYWIKRIQGAHLEKVEDRMKLTDPENRAADVADFYNKKYG